MLTKQKRYTAQEWTRLRPIFRNWSEKNLEAARLILVEGIAATEAAKRVGTVKQQAHYAATRAHARIEKKSDEGRLPLTVWVKSADMERIADLLRKHDCIIGGDAESTDDNG